MRNWKTIFVAVLSVTTTVDVSAAEPGKATADRWWSHVSVLADDSLEGRDTGSEGHRKAAAYVAKEFEKAGLKPAGTDGYFQSVRFQSLQVDEAHSRLTLVGQAGQTELTLGTDANLSMRVDPATSVDAGLVFAGYGLSIPEANYDDFKGLDVRGKVVVYLAGPPPSIPTPLAAHMQTARERSAVLARLGAIGTAAIANPKNMDIPWERATLARLMPAMRLADPEMYDSQGQQIAVAINPAHADKWLAGTGYSIQEILELADAGQPLPHFSIPTRLQATVAVKRAELESQNVAAMLPGTDPVLKDEFVVFTAHLDHLGIGQPIKGDSIYNGAMDNAAGIATMLELAASLKDSGQSLRRSVLFVAVTGEEKGLLGSRYFATLATTGSRKIVANINVDMYLPLFPFKILTIYGMQESDLGDVASEVARSLGVTPQADPEPKRNLFIRSDQYSFIRQGVPALALKVGFTKDSPEAQIAKQWLTDRYHAPSDDLNQPVDRQSAHDFNRLVARLLETIANQDQRPRWKDSSFFKRFAKD